MRKTTKLRINTVNVNGDFDSFKAALNRSILGVTFRKFKRKKSQFYQHRVHNAAIAQKICEKLYEHLLVNEHLHVGRNLRDFKLRTSLTVEWSETGVTAPVLQSVGVDIITFITRDVGTTWRGIRSWREA